MRAGCVIPPIPALGHGLAVYTTVPVFNGKYEIISQWHSSCCTASTGKVKIMRALIVDDDETSCKLLAKIINSTGLEVDWTTDSLAGYNLSLTNPYALIILDVRMPLLLGTEIAEGLKKENPQAKIILISAFADEALKKTAEDLEVVLLSKPFTPDRLLEITSALLDRQAR